MPRADKTFQRQNILQNKCKNLWRRGVKNFHGRIKADSAVNPECLAAEEWPSWNHDCYYAGQVWFHLSRNISFWNDALYSTVVDFKEQVYSRKEGCLPPGQSHSQSDQISRWGQEYITASASASATGISISISIIDIPVTSTAVYLSVRAVVHRRWVEVAIARGASETTLVPILIIISVMEAIIIIMMIVMEDFVIIKKESYKPFQLPSASLRQTLGSRTWEWIWWKIKMEYDEQIMMMMMMPTMMMATTMTMMVGTMMTLDSQSLSLPGSPARWSRGGSQS